MPRGQDSEGGNSGPGRPIWSGSISFGLVNIPITLHSLETIKDVSFHMVDARDHAPIRYRKVNENSGEEVPKDQIVKAYEYEPDSYVIFEEEDMEKLAPEATKALDVEAFVQLDEIDPTLYMKPYLVLPKKKSEKGYVLLRDTLVKTGKVGIGRIVIRTKENLAAIVAIGDALVINLMRFEDELRKLKAFPLPDKPAEEYNVNPKELDLAEQLVAAMSKPFEITEYRDRYREKMMDWLAEKAKTGTVAKMHRDDSTAVESTNVVDLAALLRSSLPSESAKSQPKAKKKA